MKFKIIETGSKGNAYIVRSSGWSGLIDCGTGTYKKVCANLNDNEKLDFAIFSHQHLDHYGDFHKVQFLEPLFLGGVAKISETVSISRFGVFHGILNYGYIVADFATSTALVFAIDFFEIKPETLIAIKKTLRRFKKVIFAIELSFNEFILQKMVREKEKYDFNDPNFLAVASKISGLLRHCSDSLFCRYLSYWIKDVEFEYKIITLHKSAEGLQTAPTLSGWNNPKVPKNYFANIGLKKLFKNIQIGLDGAEIEI